jgi:hypothetical protein
MKRYIVLYKAPLSVASRFAQATPEEAQQGLKLWIDWAQKLGPALLDPGRPLGNSHRVTRGSAVPTDSRVIGMSLIRADSMDHALDLVRDHHHLHWAEDCEIELLEEMPIPELAQPGA